MRQGKIVEPKSDKEWDAYLECRYLTLRKPWNEPKGSEVAEDDDESFHAMFVDNSEVLGVVRLHCVEEDLFQIRFMGVLEKSRGEKIGFQLLTYMENLCKAKKGSKIILHARENAVPFYKSLGYTITHKSYLLFGKIQHYQMEKVLRTPS